MKYRYRAISDRKEEKRGILEAENQMQAVAMIRENGDLILELEQVHKWWEVLTGDIYVAGMKLLRDGLRQTGCAVVFLSKGSVVRKTWPGVLRYRGKAAV